MYWERIPQYLVYVLVRLVICIAQAVRIETCQRASAALGFVFSDLLKIRRQVILENLAQAFPEQTDDERRRLARQMWEHLFLFSAEMAHTARKIHETNWYQFVCVQRNDLFVRTLLSDRPLVIVTAHYGNFELAGYLMGLFGFQSWAVARTLDNPFLDDFIHRARSLRGQRLLSKKGDYEQIGQVLAGGGAISFLADQYAGSKGCWVEFFGRSASTHKAIALFALSHDAPLAVGLCRRVGGPMHYELSLAAVADPQSSADHVAGVRELTQWYTAQLEHSVRQSPEQYWWLHRRWKDSRKKRRQARQAA